MKIIILLSFFLLYNCAGSINKSNRIYICGDHACKSKKEASEYFDQNISIEVYTIETNKKKEESLDLVDLNLKKN